jgi:hypothetical protein
MTDDSQFLVSAWTRPGGKVLLQVLNLHKDDKTTGTITLDAKALALPAGFKVYDVEQGPMLGKNTADMREVDRLLLQDPVANNGRAQQLLKSQGQVEANVTYNPSQWQMIGQGPTFQVSVPTRDFVTLIIE